MWRVALPWTACVLKHKDWHPGSVRHVSKCDEQMPAGCGACARPQLERSFGGISAMTSSSCGVMLALLVVMRLESSGAMFTKSTVWKGARHQQERQQVAGVHRQSAACARDHGGCCRWLQLSPCSHAFRTSQRVCPVVGGRNQS